VAENIRASTPVLQPSAVLIILIIVQEVNLAVRGVRPGVEEHWFVLQTHFFFQLPHCPLFHFKPVFLDSSLLHVAVLQFALVLSPPGVCWSHQVVQSFREVVQLEREMAKTVHVPPFVRKRSPLPYLLRLGRLYTQILDEEFVVPVAENFERFFTGHAIEVCDFSFTFAHFL
jgi:hypothetical protein